MKPIVVFLWILLGVLSLFAQLPRNSARNPETLGDSTAKAKKVLVESGMLVKSKEDEYLLVPKQQRDNRARASKHGVLATTNYKSRAV